MPHVWTLGARFVPLHRASAELRVEHFNYSFPINPNPLPGGERARKKPPRAGLGLPGACSPRSSRPQGVSVPPGEELGAGGGVGGVADGERKLQELQAATKPPQEPRAAATRTPSRGSRGKKKNKATLPTQLCKTLGKTPHPPQKHSPQRQGWLSGRCSLFPSEGFRPVRLQEQRRAVCGVPLNLE